ncbi:hypothetical protein GFS24_12515 [Chitinophaga sp. SYP-B3965]|uniref:DUF6934 family protein n=1 Tax=Chitinophaga sp. SYP-B3965 TaxID=2663120 RepID=UPI0012995820|nr:hypothetical protein [Chitinophaga sp. SYP-B3965]MRG45943.1 hypothetical protein [Chitinophaga sp. SYP-B3965]
MYTYDSIYEPKQLKYDVAQNIKDDVVRYIFISKGERNILKVIDYSFMEELNGKKLFNFGFGNYDFETDIIEDIELSNNGDTYKVFNTVLSTVPLFFEIHSNAIIMIEGSDSGPEFLDKCRANCRKNCADICKNANRRINIYRGYVNKHYDTLKMDYTFYGGLDSTDNKPTLIDYMPDHKQESIILMKNKNQHSMKVEENQTQEVMEPTSAEEMIALFLERRKQNPDVDLFAKQNARMREKIKGLVLPDHLRLDL